MENFDYFLVQRSSPLLPPLREGLALLPRPASLLPGSHPPPPPSFLAGCSLLSSLCPARRDETSSFEARRRCMKLQKPPRLHSPFSFWRQQASRKSVTGESSAYNGRPDNESQADSRIRKPRRPTCVPPIIQIINSCLRFGLPLIPSVNITN